MMIAFVYYELLVLYISIRLHYNPRSLIWLLPQFWDPKCFHPCCWSQQKGPRSSPLTRSWLSWAGHNIAYAGTTLTKAEKRYCVTRRELLALIGSLSLWRWCCQISLRRTDGPSWTGIGSEMLRISEILSTTVSHSCCQIYRLFVDNSMLNWRWSCDSVGCGGVVFVFVWSVTDYVQEQRYLQLQRSSTLLRIDVVPKICHSH